MPAKSPRVECRRGTNPHEWGLALHLALMLYDGPVVEVHAHLGTGWLVLRLRLWYSAAMLRRSWDRWEAECLAGEHRGITVGVGE